MDFSWAGYMAVASRCPTFRSRARCIRRVATMARYSWPGRISHVGLERLKIQCPQGTTVYRAMVMDNVLDAWVKDVVGQETQNAWNVNKNSRGYRRLLGHGHTDLREQVPEHRDG